MIEVRGLKKSIRNGSRTVEILKGIDLKVPQGQFLAIMGASGSGKSTLLGLLAGLDAPSEGEVLVDGTEISRLAEDKLAQVRGKKIGFVFQSYQLIPTLTALENVLLPYELNANGDGKKRATALLEAVGLADRLDHYPVQLSGGEQQRVALARAFVLEPPIVLADEPTGNLDSTNGQHVLDLLTERQHEANTTLVLVTHDKQIADRADRRIFLRDGRIVSDEAKEDGMELEQKPALGWGTAAKIAWRELRASRAKFLFVILSVAIGVAALTGVRGFSESFQKALLDQARSIMAGDLSARMFRLATPQENAKLDAVAASQGVERTSVTETVSMASLQGDPVPLLVSLKVVDPAKYPFYGTMVLNPVRRSALAAYGFDGGGGRQSAGAVAREGWRYAEDRRAVSSGLLR